MSAVRIFRLLVVLEILFSLGALGAYYSTAASLPPSLHDYLSEPEGIFSRMEPGTPTYWMIFGTVVAVQVSISAGLFFFWRPARPLYVILTLLTIALNPFAGPTVETALESTFYYVGSLCTGGLVALMYWSEVKERFKRAGG